MVLVLFLAGYCYGVYKLFYRNPDDVNPKLCDQFDDHGSKGVADDENEIPEVSANSFTT